MINEILNKYSALNLRHYKKHKAIEKMEQQRERMAKRLSHKEGLLKPLAKALAKAAGEGVVWDIGGPYGINAHCSIELFRNKEDKELKTEEHPFGKPFCRLTVMFYTVYNTEQDDFSYKPKGQKLIVVDYSVNTEKYAKGTIGEVNGGNFGTIDASDWTLEQLIEFGKI